MYECLFACIHVYYTCAWYPSKSMENLRSPGTDVTDGCGFTAKQQVLLTTEPSLSSPPRSAFLYNLDHPPRLILPKVSWALSYQSLRKCSTDKPSGQCDGGNSSTEVPSSQVTLKCVKWTKTNQHITDQRVGSLLTWHCQNGWQGCGICILSLLTFSWLTFPASPKKVPGVLGTWEAEPSISWIWGQSSL